jgi:hypothetical protein
MSYFSRLASALGGMRLRTWQAHNHMLLPLAPLVQTKLLCVARRDIVVEVLVNITTSNFAEPLVMYSLLLCRRICGAVVVVASRAAFSLYLPLQTISLIAALRASGILTCRFGSAAVIFSVHLFDTLTSALHVTYVT